MVTVTQEHAKETVQVRVCVGQIQSYTVSKREPETTQSGSKILAEGMRDSTQNGLLACHVTNKQTNDCVTQGLLLGEASWTRTVLLFDRLFSYITNLPVHVYHPPQ